MATMSDSAPDQPATPAQISVEDFLAQMPQGMGALNERMGIELVEISAERVVATMPVEGNTQPYGLLHGGASVVLAETLGSVGSALHAWPDKLVGRRGHQRHPPPGGDLGHGHRRRDGDAPRAQHGDVRDRDQRRAGPAGVHLADHLRADAARSASAEPTARTGY